jgi:small subunit ribosomal protein S17
MQERGLRKTRVGVVTSDKMNKTVTVVVTRRVKHPKYGRYLTRRKKFHAHDEAGECRVGDKVRIIESRPLSKTKRWRVVETIEKAPVI